VALAISFSVFYRRGSPAVAGSSSGKAADVGLPIAEKSIAVLPFENLSEEKANAYFANGIQDEILTRLSKIADLKVISRTSTQHYKSAPENLPEIARQLGVAHILEGSVQKSGDAVRDITGCPPRLERIFISKSLMFCSWMWWASRNF
jgi:TolB-like protein